MRPGLAAVAFLVCVTALPVAAAKAKPAAKPSPATARVQPLPGRVDAQSLGFGSTQAEVEALLGPPSRTVPLARGAKWFYGLSNITFTDEKVTGWSVFDNPLRFCIGTAQPGGPVPQVGGAIEQLIGSRGTPSSVTPSGVYAVWCYGGDVFTLEGRRIVGTPESPPPPPRPLPTAARGSSPSAKSVKAGQKPFRSQGAVAAKPIVVTNLASAATGSNGAHVLLEYAENVRAANERYAGSEVEVAGVIKRVGRASCGRPYIRLYAPERPYFALYCAWDRKREAEWATLKIGQSLRITGTARIGKTGNPWLEVHSIVLQAGKRK